LSIVSQNARHAGMQNSASRLTSRSADRSFATLGAAARFQDLVKELDLPAQGVPANLLDRLINACDGQIGNGLAPLLWRAA
jgi:hypothetical protein